MPVQFAGHQPSRGSPPPGSTSGATGTDADEKEQGEEKTDDEEESEDEVDHEEKGKEKAASDATHEQRDDAKKEKHDRRACHVPSWGRIFWCIYILPMLTLLLALALICYIPWFFSKKALRPWLFIGSRKNRTMKVTELFHGFYRAGHVHGKGQSFQIVGMS